MRAMQNRMTRVRPMLPGMPVMVLTISERRGITTARVVVVPAKRPKTATRLMAFPIQPSTLLPNSGRQVSEIFCLPFSRTCSINPKTTARVM